MKNNYSKLLTKGVTCGRLLKVGEELVFQRQSIISISGFQFRFFVALSSVMDGKVNAAWLSFYDNQSVTSP